MINLKTFLGWLCQTNTPKLSKSNGFKVKILGQNALTFMIPIYSTTVL